MTLNNRRYIIINELNKLNKLLNIRLTQRCYEFEIINEKKYKKKRKKKLFLMCTCFNLCYSQWGRYVFLLGNNLLSLVIKLSMRLLFNIYVVCDV